VEPDSSAVRIAQPVHEHSSELSPHVVQIAYGVIWSAQELTKQTRFGYTSEGCANLPEAEDLPHISFVKGLH
jgi:hypothetical protein